jgi:hypothetical protein
MTKITHGDTVAHYECTGLAVAIPDRPGLFVAVFSHPGYALIFTENGNDLGGWNPVNRVDMAQAVWDTLDPDLRKVLIGNTNKFAAIKYLRSITNLGLTEAKRAIETFTT